MFRSSYSRITMIAISLALLVGVAFQAVAQSQSPANDAFDANWSRTDKPVLDGDVPRTWIWGPKANSEGLMEPYAESPGGERLVQYYDKSRMELTQPDAPNDSPWFVTNGLLVLEMVEGYIQTGDSASTPAPVSEIPVAGDSNYENAPTYSTVAQLVDLPPRDEGSTITEVVQRDGTVGDDPALAEFGVTSAVNTAEYGRDHRVASVFLEFMQQRGLVYVDGELIEDRLFLNDYYATGLPIAEAYWAEVSVGGTEKMVLFQCFERRCLTYTPDNPEGWKVEAGNVGQHYFSWRYESQDPADDDSTATASVTVTEDPDEGSPTSTEGDESNPTATSTSDSGGGSDNPEATPTSDDTPGNPTATPTDVPPTATATNTPTATKTATNTPTATAEPSPTSTEADSGGSDGGDGPTNPSSAAICLSGTESAFLTLINDYREDNGLNPLKASKTLNVASYYHSLDMSENDYFSHTGQDGDSPWDRMAEAGYSYNTTKAENIAHGYGTAQSVFDGWRNSSGHNKNMLNPNLTAIGIGHVSSGNYWTTDFGGFADAGPGC